MVGHHRRRPPRCDHSQCAAGLMHTDADAITNRDTHLHSSDWSSIHSSHGSQYTACRLTAFGKSLFCDTLECQPSAQYRHRLPLQGHCTAGQGGRLDTKAAKPRLSPSPNANPVAAPSFASTAAATSGPATAGTAAAASVGAMPQTRLLVDDITQLPGAGALQDTFHASPKRVCDTNIQFVSYQFSCQRTCASLLSACAENIPCVLIAARNVNACPIMLASKLCAALRMPGAVYLS